MPRVTPPDSGSDAIVYPTEHMTQVAARIIAQASSRQSTLDTTWNEIQNWIHETFDRHWQQPLLDMLTPYVNRLRASFDWQYNLASSIFDMVDAIKGTENTISQSFTTPGHGKGHGPQPQP